MVLSADFFSEIHHFLSVHLKEEKLSPFCRSKLDQILKKIDYICSSEKDVYEDYYELPCKLETKNLSLNVDFELPSRSTKSKNDGENLTLRGPLYYRYNLQCWEHYPSSILVDGRLICSKGLPPTHSPPITDNSPNSGKNSELSIFLMGYTGIMTGKDCGMNFVFKLTHPTEDTKVFATETEQEATEWIEQINVYSTGSTPTEVRIFQDQSNTLKKPLNYVDDTAPSLSSSQCSLADGDVKKYENAHLRRQPSEVLNVINNSTISNPNFLISDVKFNRSRSSYSFKQSVVGTNQNNVGYNFSGSIGTTGGTSIISSMRRKVESFGNKYRNRKSFAGFSSKGYNVTNGTVAAKSKTISVIPQEDNRRASMYSVQAMPTTKDTIYKGVAKLRVHGNRSGWMERWCQLKPKLLECYHISTNGSKPTLDFALCLEDLTLGLSNDKKHRSALRLSCDSVKQDLLFEVQDKVLMGDWIKSFIEALGISKRKQIVTCENEVIIPDYIYKDNHVIEEDIMQKSMTTIMSYGSESIYDEVCPCDSKETDLLPTLACKSPFVNLRSQRRWSSPIVEPSQSQELKPPCAPCAGRRCLRDHPLPSLPASSPDSENNSDTFSDTPTGDDKAEIESLYDYSTSATKSHVNSCTSTLKTDTQNPTYPIAESLLKTSIIYADQDPETLCDKNDVDNSCYEFSNNKSLWRVQGCSLADLIARFEPHSESQEISSTTVSSKTDSSCTPTHQHSSEDNLNSISNSFISINSFDRSVHNNPRKVSRSVSADTNLGLLRPTVNNVNKKERPHSLLMKKTSLELVVEELSLIKEDLRNLHKQKKELQRALNQKASKDTQSVESLNSIISDVTTEISGKEIRLQELSNQSKKRFTVEFAPTASRQHSDLSLD